MATPRHEQTTHSILCGAQPAHEFTRVSTNENKPMKPISLLLGLITNNAMLPGQMTSLSREGVPPSTTGQGKASADKL